MARPGRITRDPGADAARRRLERRHGRLLAGAFAKMSRIVVPARSTANTLTADGAVRRLHDRQGVIRDALMAMLTETALLGADHGWDDMERLFGVRTNAALPVTWDLVHQHALLWVRGGNAPLGLPDWGSGYGGVDSLAAQIVRGSEAQLRELIGEWLVNGEPLPHLVRRVETVTFSRRRARLIATTEVTRAYALGNIIAWRETGVIGRMRWQTARDERMCPLCSSLAGATAPVGESFASADGRAVGPPPVHPACRCWLTAVVE